MLAILAAISFASYASAAPASPPARPARAAVRRSRIRIAGAPGSTLDESAGEWGRIGLGGRLTVGSAIPEPGVVVSREPERGFPGLTEGGPTGLLLVPSARVLKAGWWAAGLHRGIVNASVGIFGLAEAGATSPDIFENLNSEDWGSRTSGFLKVSSERLSRLGRLPDGTTPWWRGAVPVVAFGIENSPNRDAETAWGGASWDWAFPWVQGDLHGGWGTGRFLRQAFAGVGVVPTLLLGPTLKLTGEVMGRRGMGGVRFAISRNLRLDFAMRFDVVPRPAPRDGWSVTMAGATLGVSQSGRLRIVEYIVTLFTPRKADARKA